MRQESLNESDGGKKLMQEGISYDKDQVAKPRVNPKNPKDTKENYRFRFRFSTLSSFIGPGFLMSIAYLDPGNIGGDLDSGQYGKYKQLYILLLSTALGWFYQIQSAKLGVVTQRNMARVCREQYSRPVRITLWLMTELAIIASDIQEVIGSSYALNILFGIPIWLGAIITISDSLIFLFIHKYGVRKLEALFVFLVSTMAITFCINLFKSDPDWAGIVKGIFVPTWPKVGNELNSAVGLIGAVIMPHNLYLHSALVLSRKFNTNSYKEMQDGYYYNAIESAISLGVSFFINVCVISTFAYYTTIETEEITLQSADKVLEASFGNAARYIWGVGLLAAGQSSTMTGTYAGQFVMEGFLDFQWPIWKRVLITRSIAICPALAVSFLNADAINNAFSSLNILQSIQLPFALIPLMKFASSSKVMGEFAMGPCLYWFGSIFGVFLFLLNFVDVFTTEFTTAELVAVGVVTLIYLIFIWIVATAPTIVLAPPEEVDLEEDEYEKVSIIRDDTILNTVVSEGKKQINQSTLVTQEEDKKGNYKYQQIE